MFAVMTGLSLSSAGRLGRGGRRDAARRFGVLAVLGEAEVDTAVAGVQPAGGDGFGAGVKMHTFHAVSVAVAEQRGLPAAEAEIGHRHRDGHVDADLDLVLEPAGGATV